MLRRCVIPAVIGATLWLSSCGEGGNSLSNEEPSVTSPKPNRDLTFEGAAKDVRRIYPNATDREVETELRMRLELAKGGYLTDIDIENDLLSTVPWSFVIELSAGPYAGGGYVIERRSSDSGRTIKIQKKILGEWSSIRVYVDGADPRRDHVIESEGILPYIAEECRKIAGYLSRAVK